MRRPIAISIVAVLLFAAAATAVVVALPLVIPGTFLDRLWEVDKPGLAAFRAGGALTATFLAALGALAFAAAVGLLRRRKWGWWIAVALFAIDGAGDLATALATGDWTKASGAAVAGALLYALGRNSVRGYLGPANR